MSLPPKVRRLLALGLIGSGAATLVSSAVSVYATLQLIEKSDEPSLGITRGDFVWSYALLMLVGAATLAAGWRLKRPAPHPDPAGGSNRPRR